MKTMGQAALAAVFVFAWAIPAVADQHLIAAVRDASAKYKDVAVALADGFVPDPGGCISAAVEGLPADLGAMGIHYINPARLGITEFEPRVTGEGLNTDLSMPSVLLYEPQADGSLVLAGVENLIFIKAWEAAGNSAPPKFGDQEWDMMAEDPAMDGDQAHGFEPHYDLHVWTERANPSGVFTPFNPAVACPAG
jgi:hypothetical protein